MDIKWHVKHRCSNVNAGYRPHLLIHCVSTVFLFFVCAVGTLSISNRRRLPSLAGPTHPQPDGHCFLDSLGASQVQGPRLFDIGGLCFYERPSSVVPGFPGGTTGTRVSHVFQRPWVGCKRDRPGSHWIGTAVLTQGTRGLQQISKGKVEKEIIEYQFASICNLL